MQHLLNKYILFWLLASTLHIYSSGFQINEHGTKALSMGGAFTALANDPSAIYFNPAGITQLTGISLLGGSTLILPSSTFRGPSPDITEYKIKSQVYTPLHLYGTYQYDDKLYFGFGVGNNYGLGTKWDPDWVGRYLAVETSLRTFFFNFVSSYKLLPQVSIGFGYSLVYGDVLIGRELNLAPFSRDAYLELQGSGIGSGFTAGILFHAAKALSLGITYRSQVSIEFNGDAVSKDLPEQLIGSIPFGDISAPLTTPENITLGVAITPLENLIITADYQYVGWDSYDKLEITFENFNDQNGDEYKSLSKRKYENGFIARLGLNYDLNKEIDMSLGFLYDKNPIKDEYVDPTLPDSDRLGFSGGVSYSLNKYLKLEAGYLFLRFAERNISNSLQNYAGLEGSITPFNGVYNSTAHLISFTINYKI